jgi:ribosome recycling factor
VIKIMETIDDVLLDAEEKMDNTLKVLHEQFGGLRTGKASPAMVDGIQVPYYGVPTRLRDIAGVSAPEPRLLVINAYDPTALPDIAKAILAANLGVTPMNDGRVIRIPIPELSEERRKEIAKVARRQSEEARVAIRNVRRDANEAVKLLQKNGKITEDERDRGLADVQKSTDAHIAKVDAELKSKELEVMAV